MQLINAPAKLVLPFANAGAKNTIPTASQIGIVAGAASLVDGFPPLTRTPLAAGGVPPSGLDMNGILYELSAVIRWANAGGGYPYDSTFANDTNVGGYPKGARVMRSDGLGYWFNTADNNVTDPEGAGAVAAGWVPDFTTGAAAVTMTSANVTLTAAQYGKPIIVITGLLTANLNLIFPSIVGEWIVINSTTGPYTITCKTAAGTGVVVNSVQALAGDATNIYSAVNDAISSMGELIASAGGTADALTATFSPAPRKWPDGVPFLVRAASANATTTPTFTANNGVLAAKTIVKGANTALAVGDIAGAGHWLLMQYDATLDVVVLLNPALGINASSATLVSIRQTVASGSVDANGQANFLSIGTGLAVNLAATSVPVTYNFAAGYGPNGAIDYVGRDTVDIASAWSSLTASSTLFLYVDRNTSTGAKTYGFSSRQPLYQPTAPAAPATDQHWFDMSVFTMKRWTGAAWSIVQRVFVGEAATGTSTVTSVTTYALNGRYRSPVASPLFGSSTVVNFNHNLGINTESIIGGFRFFAQNITSENNWPQGAVIEPDACVSAGGQSGRSIGVTGRNTASATAGSNGTGWQTSDRSTGALFQMTVNRWGYFATLSRGW